MATDPVPPDVDRIVDTLDRWDVEYVLVGGVAASSHGARRRTYDFDCLANRTDENLDRLAGAMRELNARYRVEGLTDDEVIAFGIRVDRHRLAVMEISTWRTDAGDLDVLADMPDRTGRRLRYDDLIGRAEAHRIGTVTVVVASLEDVIASKEWANRPKDHDALPELREIADRRPPAPPSPGLTE